MKRSMLAATRLAISIVLAVSANAAPNIIVFGQNSPEWNKKLGVTGTRGTCSSAPEVCMKTVSSLLQSQHTDRFYLNMVANPKTVAPYAAEYSQLSLAQPHLYEIGLDDFMDHFNEWCLARNVGCDALLRQVIDNTKSKNSNLKFGVTIYANEIAGLLKDSRLSTESRNGIDTVHLYALYREDGPKFGAYVSQIKQIFPNAKVIAGAYAVDRVDYVPCSASGHSHCSPQQEMDLFKQTFQTEVQLAKQGVVDGLEFYPGHFGWEGKWAGWNSSRTCEPDRKQQCIDNTNAMRQSALQTLGSAGR